MPPPEHNPYASPAAPQVEGQPDDEFRALRKITNWRWRLSLLILLIPAGANYVLFDQLVRLPGFTGPHVSFPRLLFVARIADSIMLLLLIAALWAFGLYLLERIAWVIRSLLARNIPRPLWLASMYRSLSHLVPVAVMGAVLWLVWLVGFYLLEMNFFVISIPVGIVAHLLGATLYVRIFYWWFRLSRAIRVADSQAKITPESP